MTFHPVYLKQTNARVDSEITSKAATQMRLKKKSMFLSQTTLSTLLPNTLHFTANQYNFIYIQLRMIFKFKHLQAVKRSQQNSQYAQLPPATDGEEWAEVHCKSHS